MDNPLFEKRDLPAFGAIEAKHIEPAVDAILAENRQSLQALLAANAHYTWENLVQALEDDADRLNRTWSCVSHLHAVADNADLRAAYQACLPKITAYASELGQHEGLYRAYVQLQENDEFASLHPAQQKTIENVLRDFQLSGIALDKNQRDTYRTIQEQLSQLESKFDENLLDATQGWQKHIDDPSRLRGLPDSALALAAQYAERENLTGWLITLEHPSSFPVMQYADNRALREEIYTAYFTRASEQGPDAGQWDNSAIMVDILSLRQQLAQLLSFDNYAEYSLAKKMASSPEEVLDFLNELGTRSKAVAEAELRELKTFAAEHDQLTDLQAWDIPYYAEKLRSHKFAFSQEQLRPYFPAPQVVEGLFAVVKRLYNIDIHQQENIDVWHDDVRFYEIFDAQGRLRGKFYLDLYARPHKRGGAWMDECVARRRTTHGVQAPVAYLTCNFTPPIGNAPALLTHDEVITLFHEFGHGLHHMLTLVDYPQVAGINGVAWDAVELPSQFMENWCWEQESLALFARHYQSGERLPDELFKKMLNARTFQSGMQLVRQLELALFDFRLHHDQRGNNSADIQALLNDVRARIAVIIPPDYNRFQHSFSHIFAGGYAAGYYSYKWAEVLSADAFSRFEENGIFDTGTGKQFLHSILEQGGARDPMELFIAFRGRKPVIEPLLRHAGILETKTGSPA